MKRILAAWLAVLCASVMLASCSEEAEETESAPPLEYVPETEAATETADVIECETESETAAETESGQGIADLFDSLAASVPLPSGDYRLSFVRAFLEGDIALIEDLLYLRSGSAKMLLDGEYSDFTLSFSEAEDDYFSSLDFGFISSVDNGIFREGENHIIVSNDGFYCEVRVQVNPGGGDAVQYPAQKSDAQEALNMWLVLGGAVPTIGNPTPDLEDFYWGAAGDYIGNRFRVTELSEYERLANVIFGMETFEPRAPLMQTDDGKWFAGGHGGLSMQYEWIDETVRDDGTVSIRIKYYADCQGLIPSEVIEYILEDTGESVGGMKVFRFVSYESEPLTEYPTFGYQF